ncbi:hypothetical protein GCM10010166_56850 [Couchioplanes caeruleus subsp. azureus]|nr:hypothetical protein GCM10010166_56850 [Couchioplanes caeruleus subsp. azureus]
MAGANWEAYNLPSIWGMLEKENACTGADRVMNWEGLAHDVRTQHRRLEEAKEALAAVWSPDKNASAQRFLGLMGSLADSMQETLTRAEDTRAGLRGVLEALSEARAAVSTWAEERNVVSTDLIPRWADGAEDEYDEKARQAMRKAEAAIADHSTQIQPPALFDPTSGRRVGPTPVDDEPGTSGSGAGAAGVGGLGSSASAGLSAAPLPVPVPHNPPPPVFGPDGVVGGVGAGTGSSLPGSGPGLAGVLPLAPPLPAGELPVGAVPPPAAGGGGGLPGPVIGGGGPVGLVPGGGPGVIGGVSRPVGGRGASAGRQAVPVRSALPSGTIIGANGAGARPGVRTGGIAGANGAGARPGAKVGGIIGANGAGLNAGAKVGGSAGAKTGAAGRPASGRQPVVQVGQAGRGHQNGTDGSSIEGTADQTWDVRRGVAPVIEPDTRTVRHDPGPGVIGSYQ